MKQAWVSSGWVKKTLFVFGVNFLFFRFILPGLGNADSISYFAYLPSLFFNHTLNLFSVLNDLQMPVQLGLTEGGLPGPMWASGTALLWSPFFFTGALLADMPFPSSIKVLSYWTNFGTFLLGLGTLFLTKSALNKLNLQKRQISVLILGAIGTPFLFYWTLGANMSHVPAAFALAAFIWAILKAREDKASLSFFIAGVIGGILVSIRPQNVTYLPLLLLAFPSPEKPFSLSEVSGKKIGFFALGLALGFLPQSLIWFKIFGDPFAFPGGYVVDLSRFRLFEVLFSPLHGIASWTPLILMSLMGYFSCFALKRRFEYAFLGVLLWAQLIPASFNYAWWNGDGFGPRLFTDSFLPLVVGLALPFSTPLSDGFKKAWRGLGIIFGLGTFILFLHVLSNHITISQIVIERDLADLIPKTATTFPTLLATFFDLKAAPRMSQFLAFFALNGFLAGLFFWRNAAKKEKVFLGLGALTLAIFLGATLWAFQQTRPVRFEKDPRWTHTDFEAYSILTYLQVETLYYSENGQPLKAIETLREIKNKFGKSPLLARLEMEKGMTLEEMADFIETNANLKSSPQ